MKKTMKILIISLLAVVMVSAFSVAAFAEAGNVAGAIEGTWNAAETQIKQVVNNVVFPIIDLVLGCSSLQNSVLRISITANPDILSGRLRRFFLLASCSR